MCARHYRKWLRHGDALAGGEQERSANPPGTIEYLIENTADRAGPLPTACRVWTKATDENGYGRYGIPVTGKTGYPHQLAYVLFVGPIPAGVYVCHRCDTPACCAPDHLFLGTAVDNNVDAITKGRARHVAHDGVRLTRADAEAIRTARAAGAKAVDLARQYGVGAKHISQITTRKRWI